MKNLMMALAAFLLPLVVFSGEGDALVAFSTRGPDRYADGTPVKAGEVYALVWVREGQTFAGVDLNGASVDPANSIVVMSYPLAKEKVVRGETCGYCPTTLFQVPASFAETHLDGTYALCLFDTRVASATGLVPSGDPKRVQGWGLVEGARVRCSKSAPAMGFADGVTAKSASALPTGESFPQPRITNAQEELTFIVPRQEGQKFFRVVRNP